MQLLRLPSCQCVPLSRPQMIQTHVRTCEPTVAVCSVWVYGLETEHHRHVEHLKHENGGKLPEKPAYEYLNRRVKPFPWGNNSLFFNPAVSYSVSIQRSILTDAVIGQQGPERCSRGGIDCTLALHLSLRQWNYPFNSISWCICHN